MPRPSWLQVTFRELVAVLLGIVIGAALVYVGQRVTRSASLTVVAHHPVRHKRHPRKHRRRHRPAPVATVATVPTPPPNPYDWPPPGPVGSGPVPTGFSDPSGYYSFNCGADSTVGATVNVCHDGTVAGVYIDDTTPDEAHWVSTATAKYALVLVGVAAGTTACISGAPQVVCLQEFYPYDCRYPPGQWGSPPTLQGNTEGYIIQRYFAWPGCGPPTPAEAQRLLALIQALHPRFILTY